MKLIITLLLCLSFVGVADAATSRPIIKSHTLTQHGQKALSEYYLAINKLIQKLDEELPLLKEHKDYAGISALYVRLKVNAARIHDLEAAVSLVSKMETENDKKTVYKLIY